MFGHGHHYYLDAFKKYGFEIRDNSKNSRKYQINHDYFELIDSHEKAYWLGFIYADGYVSSVQGYKKFGISLSGEDKQHLEKINKCMSSNYPIRDYVQTSGYSIGSIYSKLIISSSKIYDDLVKHGVYEHKTNILLAPIIDIEYYPSFILGYFDGDGSIFLNNYRSPFYSITFVGTDDVLTFIHNYILSKNLTNRPLNLEKRKKGQIVSNIRYGGNVLVSNILDDLYKDIAPDLPLKRKRELYLKCKNRIFS